MGTVKGNWTLSVPVSGTALNNATETVFLQDASTTYDEMTLKKREPNCGSLRLYAKFPEEVFVLMKKLY